MKIANSVRKQVNETQLERVIEPLASYISAARSPRAVLISALAALVREVEETERAATAHVASVLAHHRS